jgi:hypothetical protein
VFPKDRLQSAAEWVEMIDTEKRRRAALERAKRDKMLEQAIVQLVESTSAAETLPEAGREAAAAGGRASGAPVPGGAAALATNTGEVDKVGAESGRLRRRRRTSVLTWMLSGALSRLTGRGANARASEAFGKD